MKLSNVFSKMSRDWSLIIMTHSRKLNEGIKAELYKKGWSEETAFKYIFFGEVIPIIIKEEIIQFRKGKHIQGEPEWYRDLSSICSPEHKPGLLTNILG